MSPNLPVDALIEPLAEDQVKGTFYSLLTAVGVNTTSWRSGGTARTIVAIFSKVVAGFTVLMAAAIRGTILEYSTGVWLTILAYYKYGVTRIGATFAEGEVTLTNGAGGVYDYEPGELVVLNTTKKTTYTNTAKVHLGALQTLPNVPVRAVEIGSESTATPGQIDAFVTPPLGVTVTNSSALVAQDEQDDDSLKAACIAALGALSPFGAEDAYRFFAQYTKDLITNKATPLLTADGTAAIGVNRVQVVPANLGGAVNVYVATPSGDVAGDVSTPGDDLYIVEQNLKKWATPQGITEHTYNATADDVTVLYQVYADSAYGATAAKIRDTIDAALTDLFSKYRIGGKTLNGTNYYMFVSEIRACVESRSVHPAIVSGTLVSPLVNVSLDPGHRAKLVLAFGRSVTLVSP